MAQTTAHVTRRHPTSTRSARPADRKRAVARVGIVVSLLLAVLLQLLPFYITLTTALKPRTDLSSQWALPIQPHWQNFATAVDRGNILTAIGNSLVVTAVATVLACLLGALAAYPLARRNTWGNKAVLLGLVGLIMVPPLSILVPLYALMRDLGAINTRWGLILVMVAIQLPLSIFLYASFMRRLPVAIEEAAVVDGAGTLRVLFLIVFPMLRPVTATVAILTGVAVWNDYALSVFLVRSPETRTIAPAIGTFFSSSGSDLGAAAAASLLSVLPILAVYLALQNWFVKGMVAGAEK
jgi:raffinose/stachyose/melibiose transport system permease protein